MKEKPDTTSTLLDWAEWFLAAHLWQSTPMGEAGFVTRNEFDDFQGVVERERKEDNAIDSYIAKRERIEAGR